jgi:hypothetical protein
MSYILATKKSKLVECFQKLIIYFLVIKREELFWLRFQDEDTYKIQERMIRGYIYRRCGYSET